MHEERSRDGVPLAATLIRQLADIADELGVPFHLARRQTARV
jgi:hypothetical protein